MHILKKLLKKSLRKIYHFILYILEFIYYRFLYSKPKLKIDFYHNRYLIGGKDSFGDIANDFKNLFPDRVQTKIDETNTICKHIFRLLGNDPKKVSPEGEGYKPIDWHSDFKSGYRWDPKLFFRSKSLYPFEGFEMKAPWELSRFQHLNILGQAYLITNDKKYLEEFVNQITDWIDNNPVGFGVNWKCTMDVSIRVSNWLVGNEYFFKKDNLTEDFLYKFYSSIYEHGKFIRNHLELTKPSTNHYISNIVGLFFIAIYCPFLKRSKKWLDFCIKELSKEIEEQVYEDGCDYEASTSYHRLVLEMFFYCNLLADRAGISLAKSFKNRLKKMFDVPLYCIKPDGMIPQIGDNDNGRFLIFAKRPILEHKYLLNIASIYYMDSFFKLPNFNFDEEAFWVFGIRGKKLYEELPLRKKPLASKSFPDAGWYIIRHKNNYCFITCGPNGQGGLGGHAHNDKLSFELMMDGQEVFVDPGTYVYTPYPLERNKFRSTEYHNTIKFNGYEQNEIPEKDMFSLPEKIKIKEAGLIERNNNIVFQGKIQYAGITHKRMIILDKQSGNWRIQDSISCSKSLNGKLIFHLSPNLTSDVNGILIKETRDKITSIGVKGYSLEKEKYNYSSEYGAKVKAECLVTNISAAKDAKTLNTYIYKA